MKSFTEEWLREYKRKMSAENNTAVQAPVPKRRRSTTLDKKTGIARFTSPVYIEIHTYRKGHRWDSSNFVLKGLEDSLVHAKIIEDDCIQFVKGVSGFGYEVKTVEEERTVVEIYDAS